MVCEELQVYVVVCAVSVLSCQAVERCWVVTCVLGADAWISTDPLPRCRSQTVSHLSQLAGVVQWRHQFLLSYLTHPQLPAGEHIVSQQVSKTQL